MSLLWAALFYPINDITTTPDNPPQFVELAKLDANKDRDMAYPESARGKQEKLYPDLAPLAMSAPPDGVFKKVTALAKKQEQWSIIRVDEANFRLEAVTTTPTLKFSDDIVIEVRAEGRASAIHMRSKSRLGKSDLGANYKRIKNFFDQLN